MRTQQECATGCWPLLRTPWKHQNLEGFALGLQPSILEPSLSPGAGPMTSEASRAPRFGLGDEPVAASSSAAPWVGEGSIYACKCWGGWDIGTALPQAAFQWTLPPQFTLPPPTLTLYLVTLGFQHFWESWGRQASGWATVFILAVASSSICLSIRVFCSPSAIKHSLITPV